MPFLGHNPYEGLDVSPDTTPPVLVAAHDPLDLARRTVGRYALDDNDEAMLLELLGLLDADADAA